MSGVIACTAIPRFVWLVPALVVVVIGFRFAVRVRR